MVTHLTSNPAEHGRKVELTVSQPVDHKSNALMTTIPSHFGYGIRIPIEAIPFIKDSGPVVHIHDIPSVTKQ